MRIVIEDSITRDKIALKLHVKDPSTDIRSTNTGSSKLYEGLILWKIGCWDQPRRSRGWSENQRIPKVVPLSHSLQKGSVLPDEDRR